MNILDIAQDLITKVHKHGFKADAVVKSYDSLSVSQRLLKLEDISQAKNYQIGLRVIINNRSACVSSNDLKNLNVVVERAIEMAKHAPEDPKISLAEPTDFANTNDLDLKIFDNNKVSVDQLKEFIKISEETALSFDGITNSEGSSCSHTILNTALATSNGFANSYSKSIFSSYISVIAGKTDKMQTGYEHTVACNFDDLTRAKELGKQAARRAVKKLNPCKIKTCKVPVIIENRVASELLKALTSAINGENIANGTSFLLNHYNKKVFQDVINIIDDPLLPKGIASRPFDGEGISSKINTIVDNGVIRKWLLDIYSGNRLGLKTTGHAIRNSNASIKPGPSNLYIKNSNISVDSLISDIKEGLYITDLFGFGINIITGDYSQGAFGFWIENGKISYPVHEITIADNLLNMFANMSVANDIFFFDAINSPTIRINEMTVAGIKN